MDTYYLELFSKIIVLLLFLGAPIFAFFCYMWAEKIKEKENRYKITIMTSSLNIFQYLFPLTLAFLLVFFVFSFIFSNL